MVTVAHNHNVTHYMSLQSSTVRTKQEHHVLSPCFQLYLSTRRGAWILNRVGDNGLPLDMLFNRVVDAIRKILPFGFFCGLAETTLNRRFDHSLYNLKPKHRYCIIHICLVQLFLSQLQYSVAWKYSF